MFSPALFCTQWLIWNQIRRGMFSSSYILQLWLYNCESHSSMDADSYRPNSWSTNILIRVCVSNKYYLTEKYSCFNTQRKWNYLTVLPQWPVEDVAPFVHHYYQHPTILYFCETDSRLCLLVYLECSSVAR